MTTNENHLLTLLRERAVIHGDFELSSGGQSDTYIDVRRVAMTTEGARMIGEAIRDRLESWSIDIDAIGGPEAGAIPLVMAALTRCPIYRGFWVRREPRTHGAMRMIEGALRVGDRVVVVDDVVTTGASILRAVRYVGYQCAEVVGAISLVDRRRWKLMDGLDCPYDSIFAWEDLVPAAVGAHP